MEFLLKPWREEGPRFLYKTERGDQNSIKYMKMSSISLQVINDQSFMAQKKFDSGTQLLCTLLLSIRQTSNLAELKTKIKVWKGDEFQCQCRFCSKFPCLGFI